MHNFSLFLHFHFSLFPILALIRGHNALLTHFLFFFFSFFFFVSNDILIEKRLLHVRTLIKKRSVKNYMEEILYVEV